MIIQTGFKYPIALAIFALIVFLLIFLSANLLQLVKVFSTTTSTTTTITTTTTTSTTTTTTTTTIPTLDLNESAITAPMLIENLRWKKLPIYVYIDNESCQLHEDEIRWALDIWEAETVADFKIINNPNCDNCINTTCYAETETTKTVEGEYIYTRLGEARITEYYPLDGLNVINKVEVYIYRTTRSCSKPIRYMHEFGHALGLAHANNTQDIMHQYVECNMVITDEIKSTLAELYSDKVDKYVEFYFD